MPSPIPWYRVALFLEPIYIANNITAFIATELSLGGLPFDSVLIVISLELVEL